MRSYAITGALQPKTYHTMWITQRDGYTGGNALGTTQCVVHSDGIVSLNGVRGSQISQLYRCRNEYHEIQSSSSKRAGYSNFRNTLSNNHGFNYTALMVTGITGSRYFVSCQPSCRSGFMTLNIPSCMVRFADILDSYSSKLF